MSNNELKLQLQIDFITECLRVAALKCSHAADNLILNDTICAERDIQLAISHLKVGSQSFREFQKMVDTPVKK